MKRNLSTLFFALGLAACSGGGNSTPNRLQATPGVGPNGLYNPAVNPQGAQMNCQPADYTNPQSPCFNQQNVQNGIVQPGGVAPTYGPGSNGLPVNGQFAQGQNFGGGQGPTNFQNPALYAVQMPSTDIDPNSGRILHRTFELGRGSAGEETVNDTCYPDKHFSDDLLATSSVPDSRMLHSTMGDRFELIFDPVGNLTINAQSVIGRVKSEGTVPYYLDEGSQTITIGATGPNNIVGIHMIGQPNPNYAHIELTAEQQVEAMRNKQTKEEYNIKETSNPSAALGSNVTPFVLNHGQTQSYANQGAPTTQTYAAPGVASNGAALPAIPGQGQPGQQNYQQNQGRNSQQQDMGFVTLEFPEGLTAHIENLPSAPYHIAHLFAGQDAHGNVEGQGVVFHSSAFIKNTAPARSCTIAGDGAMKLLFLPSPQ